MEYVMCHITLLFKVWEYCYSIVERFGVMDSYNCLSMWFIYYMCANYVK
jgi:hypothetical protein